MPLFLDWSVMDEWMDTGLMDEWMNGVRWAKEQNFGQIIELIVIISDNIC